jgi:acetylornithine deacetylase/succinyl-diaminopimelate desuccinylase-like protein
VPDVCVAVISVRSPARVRPLATDYRGHHDGFTHQRMISRAYHDSLFMSRVPPAAMLFIPCRDGVSHRPDECASPEAIARGATVLADALAQRSAK